MGSRIEIPHVWRWIWAGGVLAAAVLLGRSAHAEGSRSLFPATYSSNPTTCDANNPCRADMDLRNTGSYAGVTKQNQFLYVFAEAGEYILLGSRNRGNSGDIRVYNPQSFGAKGSETVPTTINFSCAAASGTYPGSYSGNDTGGNARGLISTRAAELAGPNSANNSATVTNGYAPCAYLAPTTGVYGVVFTAANTGGTTANGIIDPPRVSSGTVSAWDVTVRASLTSTADLNGRLFTYAWVGYTGNNPRPVYHTLYYVTLDGYRYQQDSKGLDPNAYALYANAAGFSPDSAPALEGLTLKVSRCA